METERMSGARPKGDIGARAFAWYWRRLYSRAKDPRAFLRLLSARRAELDQLAQRVERRLARDQREEAGGAERGVLRPDCLSEAIEPGVLVDPPSGTAFGDILDFHHDDEGGAFCISQRPTQDPASTTRFDLFFESYAFRGEYFSISVSLPLSYRKLSHDQRLALEVDIRSEWALKGHVRLNVQSVNGSETFYDEAVFGREIARSVFDFAFVPFEIGDNDSAWFDIILDRPHMVEFVINDLTVRVEEGH